VTKSRYPVLTKVALSIYMSCDLHSCMSSWSHNPLSPPPTFTWEHGLTGHQGHLQGSYLICKFLVVGQGSCFSLIYEVVHECRPHLGDSVANCLEQRLDLLLPAGCDDVGNIVITLSAVVFMNDGHPLCPSLYCPLFSFLNKDNTVHVFDQPHNVC
jgi:hypothetical protein